MYKYIYLYVYIYINMDMYPYLFRNLRFSGLGQESTIIMDGESKDASLARVRISFISYFSRPKRELQERKTRIQKKTCTCTTRKTHCSPIQRTKSS